MIYAMDGGEIVIATDYGTRKLKNLKENSRVSLVVDDYRPNRAVVVEGEVSILERGEDYRRLLKILFDRFESYRKSPWEEGEAPILRVKPTKLVSWGM